MILTRIGKSLLRRSGMVRLPPRRHCSAPRGLDFDRLVQRLEALGIAYLFLHWPQAKEPWPKAGDFLLLVADDDLPRLAGLLRSSRRRGGLRGTLYTASGLPGTDLNGVPYLPVVRARELLASGERRHQEGRLRLATRRERLMVMGFELAYHRGSADDLHTEVGRRTSPAWNTLANLAEQESEVEPSQSLETLETWLATAGWRPPTDTLLKLSVANDWLDNLLEAKSDIAEQATGLATYLIRETGIAHLDKIRQVLELNGFDILYECSIGSSRRRKVADRIRGGNWSRGPMPRSGGLPAHLLVVHDVHPQHPDPHLMAVHQGLDNARVFTTKCRIRDLVNRDCKPSLRSNPAHSSDNVQQAIEYLSEIAPDAVPLVQALACERNAAFRTPYPVLADLSKYARRAKVELVDFHGVQAVCKTFRPGRERFLYREVKARELGRELPEVSQILEIGDHYLVFECYEDSIDSILSSPLPFHGHGYLPFWAIDRLKAVILHYRRKGFECVDLYPENLIYDPVKGLKIIDFEFLQPGLSPREDLKGNFAWYPVPENFTGDVPQVDTHRPYLRWFAYTGLPRYFCLGDYPRPLLVSVRAATWFAIAGLGLHRLVRQRLGLGPWNSSQIRAQ